MTVPPIQTLSEVVESKITQDNNNMFAKSSLASWCSSVWRKILAEFISTMLLLLLGCMTCIPMEGYISAVYAALGFGMVVMFNIEIFGHISGAFMNPAVTLSSMIWGSTSIPLGIIYIIVQCAGAIAGFGILDAITPMDLTEGAVCVTKPYAGLSSVQTLCIEIAVTVILIFLNCSVWDPVNKEKKESVSIKFGLTILGLSLVAGPFTGAGMNPARSLGPAVWTNLWTDHWTYWVGPIVASVFATLLYKIIFLQKRDD
ncbi:aquaporin-like [Anticarsia gemmatalis]|uniref:aquaporin-like n=1 Tax=Anticarsia gemmatalis TaxID=129554 RepID=UPI003F775EED